MKGYPKSYPMTAIYDVLEQAGWPTKAKDDRGTLTFTASSGDIESLRSTSAALLVGHDKIQARIRSSVDMQTLEPHLEIQWSLSGNEATLVSFIQDGQARDLDEGVALEAWQNAVNRLGATPKFQQLAPRKTPASPSRQPGM
jgi:hypothetical protein